MTIGYEEQAKEIQRLTQALEDVAELIDGYVDVSDGPDGGPPQANAAMRAAQVIDIALRRGEGWKWVKR